MRAKRAAMLADNAINIPVEVDNDEDDADELENLDENSTDTSEDSASERLSVMEPEQVTGVDFLVRVSRRVLLQEDLQIDQETRSSRCKCRLWVAFAHF